MFAKHANALIGKTPIVYWGTFHKATIWVKDEGRNLTGSLKDRTARIIVSNLMASGNLANRTLLDASSGSYACSLAMQGRLHEVPTALVVNEKISATNLAYIERLGATVIRYGKVTGDGMEYCRRMVTENPENFVFTDQLNNPLAVEAHFSGTAPEIFADFRDPTAVVVSIGSGATALGVARYMRKHQIGAKLFGSVGKPGDVKKIAGTYRSDADYISPFINELIDGKMIEQVPVGYQDAMDVVWEHLVPRGIQVGPQGGGVLLAAMQAIREHKLEGDVIVVAGDSLLKNMDRWQ